MTSEQAAPVKMFTIPGFESLSSQITDSIQSSHVRVGGGSGAVERDILLYERKAAHYLSNLALNAAKDNTKDPNDNEDEEGPTVLQIEDPVVYWRDQVNIKIFFDNECS